MSIIEIFALFSGGSTQQGLRSHDKGVDCVFLSSLIKIPLHRESPGKKAPLSIHWFPFASSMSVNIIGKIQNIQGRDFSSYSTLTQFSPYQAFALVTVIENSALGCRSYNNDGWVACHIATYA